MKFRNKILLTIWGLVLILVTLIFFIMQYWMREQILSRFANELQRNYSTLHELATLRAEQDLRSGEIIAGTPSVKAVTDIGDPNTAIQHIRELNTGIRADLFVITDSTGSPIVHLIDGSESDTLPTGLRSISSALRGIPSAGVCALRSGVYRIVSSPITVGGDRIGTLTIGFKLQLNDILSLKALTNSEVTLTAEGRPILSTLPAAETGEIGRALGADRSHTGAAALFTFDITGESYIATFYRLGTDSTPTQQIGYLLAKPVNREVEAALSPFLNALLVLSAIALFIAGLIGYFISGTITKPIAALVEGTAEVSRGNYDVRIAVSRGGELHFLARKFEEMAGSLKDNVSQLSRQNVELQTTLQRLEETQEDRIRLATNLQLLLESTGEGIYGVDTDGKCVFINRAAAEMLRVDASTSAGADMHEMFHHSRPDGSRYPSSECPITAVLRTGVGCRIDGEVMWRSDRSTLPVEYSCSPIVVDGALRGAVVAFTDVTERRMLQQHLMQTQKIESIGRLAGGIAHDFNNILSIIIGHADILRRARGNSHPHPESITAITKASQRGAALVKQLLTFARKTEVTLQSVRLNDVLTEVATLLRETFPKTITIDLHTMSDPPSVVGDPNQLHQVFVNLCVNARDAMPEGGTLRISSGVLPRDLLAGKFPRANSPEYFEVQVVDTGTGMDEPTLRRIFEPFFTTKGVGKGTGLGLAVVFGIVETHKGMIDVKSSPGKGTTFHLYFPVQPRHSLRDTPERDEMVDIPGGTETILLVEDEELLRELLADVLATKGYTVLTAGDGIEMVEQFTRHRPVVRLVLTDMGLPKLSGYEGYRKLREITPEVKVILASGYIDPNTKSEILKAGVKEFIQKPYLPDEVLKKVRDVLDAD